MSVGTTYTGSDSRNPLYWRRSAAEYRDPSGVLMRTCHSNAERKALLRDAAGYDFIASYLEEHDIGFPSAGAIEAASLAALIS